MSISWGHFIFDSSLLRLSK